MPIHKHLRRRKSLQNSKSALPETSLKVEIDVQRRRSSTCTGSYNGNTSTTTTTPFPTALEKDNHHHQNKTEDHASNSGNSVVVSEGAEDSEHEDNNAPFFTVGTRVKHYETGRVGWVHGNVVAVSKGETTLKAVEPSSLHSCYTYTVLFENGSIDEYNENEISKMVDIGQVCLGSRIAVYWGGDEAYYPARVTKIDNRKISCFHISYTDDNEKEWIDLRDEKFVLLHDDGDLDETYNDNHENESTITEKPCTILSNTSSSVDVKNENSTKSWKKSKKGRKVVESDDEDKNAAVVKDEIEDENESTTRSRTVLTNTSSLSVNGKNNKTTRKRGRKARKIFEDDDSQHEVAVKDEIENENKVVSTKTRKERKNARKVEDDDDSQDEGVVVKNKNEIGTQDTKVKKKRKNVRKIIDDDDDDSQDGVVLKSGIENENQDSITKTKKERKIARKIIDDDDSQDGVVVKNKTESKEKVTKTSSDSSSSMENNSTEITDVKRKKIARNVIQDNDDQFGVVLENKFGNDNRASISTKRRRKMARKVVRSENTVTDENDDNTWKDGSLHHAGVRRSRNRRSSFDEEQPNNKIEKITSSRRRMQSSDAVEKRQRNSLEEEQISICIEDESLCYLESEGETPKEQIQKKRKVGRPRKNAVRLSHEDEENEYDKTRRKIKNAEKKLYCELNDPLQLTTPKRKRTREIIEWDEDYLQPYTRPQRCKVPKRALAKYGPSNSIASKSIRHYDSWNARTTNEQNSLLVKLKVGTQVSVYWAEDDRYYHGTVSKMKDFRSKKPHFIEYDDGDSEWVDLADHVFDIVSESRSGKDGKKIKREKQSTVNEATTTKRRRSEDSFDFTAADRPLNKVQETTPNDVSALTVGARVAVWWEEDSQFYKGTIRRMRKRGKPFFVEYDDGDEEWMDLRRQKFILLQIPRVDTGADADLESCGSPDTTDENEYDFPGPPGIQVGSRLSVWWPHEKQYYQCTVTKRRDCKKGFYLEYDDGDVEWLDLNKAKYKVLSSPKTKRC